MKNLFKSLVVSAILIFVSFPGVSAVSLDPSSTVLEPNKSYTINITASPSAPAVGVLIRLKVAGATVTGYTQPSGAEWSPGAIGACDGQMYTSTQICVDLVNSSTITAGKNLGSFTITSGASGTVSITKDVDNGYVIGSSIVADTGNAGTYTIVVSSDTGTVDDPVGSGEISAPSEVDSSNAGDTNVEDDNTDDVQQTENSVVSEFDEQSKLEDYLDSDRNIDGEDSVIDETVEDNGDLSSIDEVLESPMLFFALVALFIGGIGMFIYYMFLSTASEREAKLIKIALVIFLVLLGSILGLLAV